METFFNNSCPFISFQEKSDLNNSSMEDKYNLHNLSSTMLFMKIFNESESLDQVDQIEQEHNDQVYYIFQLSSGILASGSCDNKIKLFEINRNEYKIIKL